MPFSFHKLVNIFAGAATDSIAAVCIQGAADVTVIMVNNVCNFI